MENNDDPENPDQTKPQFPSPGTISVLPVNEPPPP